jgi:hypothetical protein
MRGGGEFNGGDSIRSRFPRSACSRRERKFRVKERMNLSIRIELVNIFSRTIMPNPATANPQNQPAKTAEFILVDLGSSTHSPLWAASRPVRRRPFGVRDCPSNGRYSIHFSLRPTRWGAPGRLDRIRSRRASQSREPAPVAVAQESASTAAKATLPQRFEESLTNIS